MRGISTIIAVILMVMIVISLAGMALMFVTGFIGGKTAIVLEIVDVSEGNVVIRNSGTASLPLGDVKIYIDGVETGFMSSTDTIPAGGMATLTILNQIPVALYHFDEGAGNKAYDSSGNGNTGTLYNFGSGWVDGKFGKALQFDGVDDYVEVPDSPSLNVESITITLWVKQFSRNPNDWTYLISKGGWGSYHLISEDTWTTNRVGFTVKVGGVDYRLWTNKAIGNYWSFLAFTYDSSTGVQRTYFDGSLDSEKTNPPGAIETVAGPLRITGAKAYYFNGIIDEVRIYNRALSEEEIKVLYEKGLTERKNIRIVAPGATVSSFVDISDNNPSGISDWYSKVGRNTGKGINLCGWGCEDWVNVKPDDTWIRGKYASPVSSNWNSPPSQDSGYIVCCHYEDPSRNCAGCEITTWFKKFLVIPTTANKVWLRYSTDDPIRIYIDGNLFYERGCCCNPCPDIDLTPAITKGKGNWITIKFYEGCWCGYFGGNIWYS